MSCPHGFSVYCFQCFRNDLVELERFREREPLVQEMLSNAAALPTVGTVDTVNRDVYAVWRSATLVRDFGPCITGGAASDASAADPTGGEPK